MSAKLMHISRRSMGIKGRTEGITKMSAPFLRDTGMIIEKFVESVKDLFQYCYTEPELYKDILRMEDDQLFASLSEYLEDIKFGIYEALSENLDKISLKFLQVCDREENFEKYLKVLKDKWKGSSSIRSINRHDDKYIKSAKQFVNKLATTEAAKSKSPRGKSPMKPQLHLSEYDSSNKSTDLRAKQNQKKLTSGLQDMPINSMRGGNKEESASTKKPHTPNRDIFSGKKSLSSVSNLESPRRPSPRRALVSPSRSPTRTAEVINSGEQPSDTKKSKKDMIVKRSDHGSFTREIIDPQLNPRIKCIWPADSNRVFLGLELGKIVEIVPDSVKESKQKSVVFSGTHTIYDLVMDCQERLLFFDASFSLRMISYNTSKATDICQGEYWGNFCSCR